MYDLHMASLERINEGASVRERLVQAAVDSLIDVGFSETTGVETCRRAGVTRGALNHHFPDLGDLFVAALERCYDIVRGDDEPFDTLVGWLQVARQRIANPECKAMLELWFATSNGAAFTAPVVNAITTGSLLFSPESMLGKPTEADEAVYRTMFEALIGLTVGRSTNGGTALEHEQAVLGVLEELALASDRQQRTVASAASSETT